MKRAAFFIFLASFMILIVGLMLLMAVVAQGQSVSPTPTQEIKADLLAVNTVEKPEPASYELKGFATVATRDALAQSENKLSYSGERLRLLQPGYIPAFGNKAYLSIGSNNRRTVPVPTGLTAIDIGLPLTINGTNKFYVGQNIQFDLQGSPVNPQVIGSRAAIFSNSLFPGGTGSLIGHQATVDVGGPVSTATGGHFGAATGSVGADGTGTIKGVHALTSVHNAGATNVFTADFWLASSSSSPVAVVPNAYAVRVRALVNNGVEFTNLRFLSLAESSKTGTGAVGTSYGIYADSTIDLGTTRYFIFSTSTSPSKIAGDVHITDTTKGIILTSPDAACWRVTINNSGVLSTASVACP